MSGTATVERILRHDRMIVGTGLALVAGIAWLYTIAGAGVAGTQQGMGGMGGMAMAPLPWSATHAAMIALMWFVMMIAMMIPSAAPTILLFAAVNRRQRHESQPYVATSFFVLGYLAVWSMFSVLATLLQWALQADNMLSPLMASTSTALAAGLLVAAGIYQLTPLKHSCLARCRAPLQFLSGRWRPGPGGALAMGAEHGAYCLGCCWFLMGLLFVGGILNPLWIGGLAIYLMIEKLAARGAAIGRAAGLLFMASGAALMIVEPDTLRAAIAAALLR